MSLVFIVFHKFVLVQSLVTRTYLLTTRTLTVNLFRSRFHIPGPIFRQSQRCKSKKTSIAELSYLMVVSSAAPGRYVAGTPQGLVPHLPISSSLSEFMLATSVCCRNAFEDFVYRGQQICNVKEARDFLLYLFLCNNPTVQKLQLSLHLFLWPSFGRDWQSPSSCLISTRR